MSRVLVEGRTAASTVAKHDFFGIRGTSIYSMGVSDVKAPCCSVFTSRSVQGGQGRYSGRPSGAVLRSARRVTEPPFSAERQQRHVRTARGSLRVEAKSSYHSRHMGSRRTVVASCSATKTT